MSYTPTIWQNSPSTATPISADNLNHIEQGIADLDDQLNGANGIVQELQTAELNIQSLDENKVSKVEGYGLSQNDFTDALKDKLDGIEVNNGTLTIQKNGQTVQTFSANQSENATANIPTDTSELSDSEPYVLRQGKGDLVDFEIVGGSVAWNQLTDSTNIGAKALFRATISRSGNSATFTDARTTSHLTFGGATALKTNIPANHKVFMSVNITNISVSDLNYISFVFRDINNSGVSGITATTTGVLQAIVKPSAEAIDASVFVQNNTAKTGTTDTITVKDMMVIDLTQLFGTTIADYIYSLEQANAGAGVAWFRQYFPNAYYAYDSGSIQSVNVSGKKIVGKNQLPMVMDTIKTINTQGTWSGNTYTKNNAVFDFKTDSNGYITRIDVSGAPSSNDVTMLLCRHEKLPANTYIGNGASDTYRLRVSDEQSGSDVLINHIGSSPTTFTFDGTEDIRIAIRIQNMSGQALSFTYYPMLRFSTETDSSFEPYTTTTYPLDSTKQLRGIPQLVNNKLAYDGDIYKADGTLTRKYGIVDLGSLAWNYAPISGGRERFQAIIADMKKSTSGDVAITAICPLYKAVTYNASWSDRDMSYSLATNSNSISIVDNRYSNASDFKTAMSGVYFVYELATPTTETALAYQNPQRCYPDGTEEFIDYGVSQSTRDVAIPVGNNSNYTANDVIEPIADYVDNIVDNIPIACKETTQGTYTLTATVDANGDVTYTWS